jgi:hypothetical protein
MEVHGPDSPLHTWKDFALHLATVTIGILIALSLEQATEWYHHKAIVREAKSNIVNELRDNKNGLDKALPNMETNLKEQEHVLQVVTDLLAHKKLAESSLQLAVSGPTLRATSWRAAEAIGALSFMEYPQLKKYAEVYEVQAEYMRMQERALDTVVTATNHFRVKDFDKQNDRDLDEARKQILASLSAAQVQKDIARQLSEEYGKVLESRE